MKQILISLVATFFFLGVLLVSAGRLTYWPAWVYASVSVLMNVLTRLLLRGRPDLAKERAKPGKDAKAWDKAILAQGLVLTIVTLIVAGLDSGRFHWSPRLSWGWAVGGLGLNLLGMMIFLLAMKENRFFSSVVRVQAERGHAVCRSGPYRVVRHPGYSGMIIGTVGLPLLLLSAWSAIPGLLTAGLLIVRTRLEDRSLEIELEGYRDYMNATRFRLVPGIW